jgi:uncharacterized protein (UPF0261 family)
MAQLTSHQKTLYQSRSSHSVHRNPIEVDAMFMAVVSVLFELEPNIVSNANVLGKISEDGNLDGSLIVVIAIHVNFIICKLSRPKVLIHSLAKNYICCYGGLTDVQMKSWILGLLLRLQSRLLCYIQ